MYSPYYYSDVAASHIHTTYIDTRWCHTEMHTQTYVSLDVALDVDHINSTAAASSSRGESDRSSSRNVCLVVGGFL